MGGRHRHGAGVHHAGFGGRGVRHGFRGGDDWGSRGIRTTRMLSSFDLQLVVLYLLEQKPQHGYEIIKAFEERSYGIYSPSPGMIYPALTYLEDVSYLRSEVQGSKKVYSLTDRGLAYLGENRSIATEILHRLEGLGRKMARMQEYYDENEPDPAEFDLHAPGHHRSWKMELHEIRKELRAILRAKSESDQEEKERVKAILKKAILEIQKAQ
jgi:DNA-binding PadR family transcriptional regulator